MSCVSEKSDWNNTLQLPSLTLQVMTAYALQRRLKDVGITVSVPHPGVVSTVNYEYTHVSVTI